MTTGHPCLVVKTLGTPTSVPVACCHDARDTMGWMGTAVSRVARQSLERRSFLERGDGDAGGGRLVVRVVLARGVRSIESCVTRGD